MSNEERISAIDLELKKHWAVIEEHRDAVKSLSDERSALTTEDQKKSIPEMTIGELLRRSAADEFEYNSTGYNPYKEARGRLETWIKTLIPENQTFDFDRYLKPGVDHDSYAYSDMYLTPKLTPKNDRTSSTTAADLADGVQKYRAACIVAFGLDDDDDIIFGVMSNDLSEHGIVQFVSKVGEVGEITMTTYGTTRTEFEGTTEECMARLRRVHYYGEPYRDDEDDYGY
jgi:hypothetical protein